MLYAAKGPCAGVGTRQGVMRLNLQEKKDSREDTTCVGSDSGSPRGAGRIGGGLPSQCDRGCRDSREDDGALGTDEKPVTLSQRMHGGVTSGGWRQACDSDRWRLTGVAVQTAQRSGLQWGGPNLISLLACANCRRPGL